MRISIKWNPYIELWFMYGSHGREMYRFCDCVNFNALYRNLDKTKVNYYEQDALYPVEEDMGHETNINAMLMRDMAKEE